MRKTKFIKTEVINYTCNVPFKVSKSAGHIVVSGYADWWDSFIVTKYDWINENGDIMDVSDLLEILNRQSELRSFFDKFIVESLLDLWHNKKPKGMVDIDRLSDLILKTEIITAESI